jgi:hypothetical protein
VLVLAAVVTVGGVDAAPAVATTATASAPDLLGILGQDESSVMFLQLRPDGPGTLTGTLSETDFAIQTPGAPPIAGSVPVNALVAGNQMTVRLGSRSASGILRGNELRPDVTAPTSGSTSSRRAGRPAPTTGRASPRSAPPCSPRRADAPAGTAPTDWPGTAIRILYT